MPWFCQVKPLHWCIDQTLPVPFSTFVLSTRNQSAVQNMCTASMNHTCFPLSYPNPKTCTTTQKLSMHPIFLLPNGWLGGYMLLAWAIFHKTPRFFCRRDSNPCGYAKTVTFQAIAFTKQRNERVALHSRHVSNPNLVVLAPATQIARWWWIFAASHGDLNVGKVLLFGNDIDMHLYT